MQTIKNHVHFGDFVASWNPQYYPLLVHLFQQQRQKSFVEKIHQHTTHNIDIVTAVDNVQNSAWFIKVPFLNTLQSFSDKICDNFTIFECLPEILCGHCGTIDTTRARVTSVGGIE